MSENLGMVLSLQRRGYLTVYLGIMRVGGGERAGVGS